jgi:hypothetical protein
MVYKYKNGHFSREGKMGKLSIKKTNIINLDTEIYQLTDDLVMKLKKVFEQVYHLSPNLDFYQQILYRGPGTKLAIFYGERGEVAGFSSAGINAIRIKHKNYAIFNAGVYFDLLYNAGVAAAKFGLTLALKYKLNHPSHQLVYVAEASNPAAYRFYCKLLKKIYPKQYTRTPDYVREIFNAVVKRRGLTTIKNSPAIIDYKSQIKPLDENYYKKSKILINDKHVQYYLSLNADFSKGQALLVYVPLDLSSISQGLKQLISKSSEMLSM